MISHALHHLTALHQAAADKGHRACVLLDGPREWGLQVATAYLEQSETRANICTVAIDCPELATHTTVTYKQARKLLGSECHFLVVDLDSAFDANGFNAACGSLVGGGILILLTDHLTSSLSRVWLDKALIQLTTIKFDEPLNDSLSVTCRDARFTKPPSDTSEQVCIVDALASVVKGHRKRPLVLTADRGRGKSSGLGIAAASLLTGQDCRIVVTAPNKAAVEPLFKFAANHLGLPFSLSLSVNGGWLRFVSPDELIESRPQADVVIVDEAAALPLPMLYALIEQYHRMVFSSTVHGYEGCGRGFTLKFMNWLNLHRKGWKTLHLSQPMRWSSQDPLEKWLNQTFLLAAEADEVQSLEQSQLQFLTIAKQQLVDDHRLLASCVGLLVNAHYQTSPNDIVTLLDDDAISLSIATVKDSVVGVVLCVEEGGLDAEIIEQVQTGKRRPAGQLVAANLANHLAQENALSEVSTRIMRIAVHPQHQLKGVGRYLLQNVIAAQSSKVKYVSTSFGITSELVQFWNAAQFEFVKLGVTKDHSSGTYSGIWVYRKATLNWLNDAVRLSRKQLLMQLSNESRALDSQIALQLISSATPEPLDPLSVKLLRLFAQGGNSISTVRASVHCALYGDGLALQGIANGSLVIDVFVKSLSTSELIERYPVNGIKQIEVLLRSVIQEWMNLHCKSTHEMET